MSIYIYLTFTKSTAFYKVLIKLDFQVWGGAGESMTMVDCNNILYQLWYIIYLRRLWIFRHAKMLTT